LTGRIVSYLITKRLPVAILFNDGPATVGNVLDVGVIVRELNLALYFETSSQSNVGVGILPPRDALVFVTAFLHMLRRHWRRHQ
jgi:hypothetical protein